MLHPAILYVEDEKTDVLLFRLAVKRAGLPNPLNIAVDGVEAIDYLAGNGPFADRGQYPLPALVLLDLNLPRISGFEVLTWARQQLHFAALPIVIYTSSVLETDRAIARQLGANDYLVKCSDVEQIAQIARDLSRRWLPPLGHSQKGTPDSPPCPSPSIAAKG
jgi:CheY-like chemotaxis protein